MAVVLAALLGGAGSSAARTTPARVYVYPSGTTFSADGPAPRNREAGVRLAMPIGAVDDAVILARGARHVSAAKKSIDPALTMRLYFAHYVSVKGRQVPDVLEPWNGSHRRTEEMNQPIWVQVTVPQGTAPGEYAGSVTLRSDGVPKLIPVHVHVADVAIPRPGQVSGALHTAFNASPQSYGNEVNKLYGIPASKSLPGFFRFLASYRISPNTWGYGNPRSSTGYTKWGNWQHDKAARMLEAVSNPRRFASMWIPISNNRSTAHMWAGGISPYRPKTWCPYLRAVRHFWNSHGWLAHVYPYLYGMDEPGLRLFRLVGNQAEALHACWPGSKLVITGKPGPQNYYLWDGGSDNVDVWGVLESRYYGEYTNPGPYKHGERRAKMFLGYINRARAHGKEIWAYTYQSRAHNAPGLAAAEEASAPRLFTAWAALEGITGILRGQAMTLYDRRVNPFNVNNKGGGDYVLIYPGRDSPVPSARLELLREGIEDWEILNIVRQKHGSRAVVKLLSQLFSTTTRGAKLACSTGCPITNKWRYSWPLFSHDWTTARKLARMRAAALAAAAS